MVKRRSNSALFRHNYRYFLNFDEHFLIENDTQTVRDSRRLPLLLSTNFQAVRIFLYWVSNISVDLYSSAINDNPCLK